MIRHDPRPPCRHHDVTCHRRPDRRLGVPRRRWWGGRPAAGSDVRSTGVGGDRGIRPRDRRVPLAPLRSCRLLLARGRHSGGRLRAGREPVAVGRLRLRRGDRRGTREHPGRRARAGTHRRGRPTRHDTTRDPWPHRDRRTGRPTRCVRRRHRRRDLVGAASSSPTTTCGRSAMAPSS